MDQRDKQNSDKKTASADVDFHGAAVIDENGNEVEITEAMVRKAIRELDSDAYPAEKD